MPKLRSHDGRDRHTFVIRLALVEITELLWDDQNITHIGGHGVTVPEVSERSPYDRRSNDDPGSRW